MKLLKKSLFFFFALFLVTGGIKPVFAGNIIFPAQEAYKECNRKADGSNDKNSSIDRTQANTICSLLVQGSLFMYGAKQTYGNTEAVQAMSPELQNAGIMQSLDQGLNAMFLNPVAVDIPTHYASILLPKEIRSAVDMPAYAARTGPGKPTTQSALEYYRLLGINQLWGISFGIAMVGFVIVLLYAGFMIMFRQKLGGQTIVSVSMSLQNLVVGVFLALVSYALGGFFLNFSKYLVLLLNAMMSDDSVFKGLETVFVMTPLALTGRLGGYPGFNNPPAFKVYLEDLLTVGGSALVRNFMSVEVWFLARLILAVMVLVTSFKVFFSVFTTYARMMLDIILAPIYFMVSSLPGKQDGYMGWIRKMFKNSLVLPVTFLIVNLGLYISNIKLPNNISATTAITGGAINADVDSDNDSCYGDCISTEDFIMKSIGPQYVVGIIIFMMAPSASKVLDELLETAPSKSAVAVGDAVKKSLGSAPLIGGLFK